MAESEDTLVTLTKLVNKSLVVWDPDASRYRVLESIRTFARARLEEAGEADTAGALHLAWCASLADDLKSHSRAARSTRRTMSSTGSSTTSGWPWTGPQSTSRLSQPAWPASWRRTPRAAPGRDWWIVAIPDRDYYEQVESDDGLAFPLVPIPRRFRLGADRVTIGRRSVQRGISPDIDLSAPPTDTGISHDHAILNRRPDGIWTVIDPGSTNRTYLNDSSEPLPFHQAVPVSERDRIHIGAWTTLSLERT